MPAPCSQLVELQHTHGSGTDEVRNNYWSPPGPNARTQDTAVSLSHPSFRTEDVDGPGAVIALVCAHSVEKEQVMQVLAAACGPDVAAAAQDPRGRAGRGALPRAPGARRGCRSSPGRGPVQLPEPPRHHFLPQSVYVN